MNMLLAGWITRFADIFNCLPNKKWYLMRHLKDIWFPVSGNNLGIRPDIGVQCIVLNSETLEIVAIFSRDIFT